MSEVVKTKLQDDETVLAYMYHNPLKNKSGECVLHDGKAIIFGSPVYLGKAAEDLGVQFSEVNRMVADREATCFVNGSVTIWKLAEKREASSAQRKLA